MEVRRAASDDERELLRASFYGDVDLVRSLLSKGVNPNVLNPVRWEIVTAGKE